MSTTSAAFIVVLALVSLCCFAQTVGAMCGTEHPSHPASSHRVGKALQSCVGHACDDPSIRDQYLLNSQSPLITINLNVIYFGQLSGTAKTTYDAQIAFFQQEYGKHMNITWNINTTVITDRYQTLNLTNKGLAMQLASEYFVRGSITVLLSVFSPNPDNLLGFSFLPQAIDLVAHPQQLFAAIDLARGISPKGTALLHEAGHMLGLLHSFTEYCTVCSENNNSTNLDVVGDYCSDTKPVWKSFSCNSLSIQDYDCNKEKYPTNMTLLPQDNYMAYTPASCQHQFTPQQAARARCYWDRLVKPIMLDPPSAPVASQVPASQPLATPIDTSTPQSTSPQTGPVATGNTPSQNTAPTWVTPSSSIVSLGSRTDVVATLVGIVCLFVSM